jgi:hypothetical protein
LIPVEPAPEPADFDERVRQPGLRWLVAQGLPERGPLPRGRELKPYWRAALGELNRAYQGYCAYLAHHFERITGLTVDHFVPKSRRVELAYEWTNYRLACGVINGRKQNFEDVLDPFEIEEQTFELDLLFGAIRPSARLRGAQRASAEATIARLRLDDGECREMRRKLFERYVRNQIDEDILRQTNPFVWLEARRQDLLHVGGHRDPPPPAAAPGGDS